MPDVSTIQKKERYKVNNYKILFMQNALNNFTKKKQVMRTKYGIRTSYRNQLNCVP